MIILQTPRLLLRKIQTDDYSSVCSILQDIDVMRAWEHAFSDKEVVQWIDENIMRYNRDGYSYWAVIEKASDELIGVTGLISEQADDKNHVGIGYIYTVLVTLVGTGHELHYNDWDEIINAISKHATIS